MNDLISRTEAWKAMDVARLFYERRDRHVAQEVIENLPTVEAKPVVHGEWEIGGIQGNIIENFKCSVCNSVSLKDSNFCPNCGADMRGGKNE